MADLSSQNEAQAAEPKLRHEFVGMMFAVAIGEVGLQTAELVHKGFWVHYLPEYSHLLVATVLIATSWVGWTLSVAPGARRDVHRIFQWDFLVLLLDVVLVIIYFIVVRLVERPPSDIALWIAGIFILYLVWDIITKVIIYFSKDQKDKERPNASWFRSYGSRMLPTVICLFLAFAMSSWIATSDHARFLGADLALLSLVLLFRALKELISALVPSQTGVYNRKWPILWSTLCAVGIVTGVLMTQQVLPLPLSGHAIIEIQAPPAQGANHSETNQ